MGNHLQVLQSKMESAVISQTIIESKCTVMGKLANINCAKIARGNNNYGSEAN